jgi:hypothetical protein
MATFFFAKHLKHKIYTLKKSGQSSSFQEHKCILLCLDISRRASRTVLILVWQQAACWLDGVQFLAGARDFSVFSSIQTGSGAHVASFTMGTRAVFPGVIWLGHESGHSSLSNAKFKNGGTIPPLPSMP